MQPAEAGTFKDPTRLVRWTKVFLYLQMVSVVPAILAGEHYRGMLNDLQQGVFEAAEAAMETAFLWMGGVYILRLPVVLTCAVLNLRWIYRANYNVQRLGATGMACTPGWAVGWFFVPFFNLWAPYEAMRELWRASANPLAWKGERVPWQLSAWWALFLFTALADPIMTMVSPEEESPEGFPPINLITQISEALLILQCGVFLWILQRVDTMQRARLVQPGEAAALPQPAA